MKRAHRCAVRGTAGTSPSSMDRQPIVDHQLSMDMRQKDKDLHTLELAGGGSPPAKFGLGLDLALTWRTEPPAQGHKS